MATDIITRVRTLVTEGGMTRAGLARAAGLHANTLRECGEEAWNPTADTLGKLARFLEANDETPVLVGIEEIIEEARNGRMFVLVDDEDRENEGDLVIPAQMATPDAINFMATHGRGLICLTLTRERTEQLGLQLMSRSNGTRHETAFTVSIEAREGVTTGISAADRARTVSVAIDPTRNAQDIVTPGHVFPLIARDGGVLVRAGHTEAAVDISRLAGLNPSGVICEIMNEDGSMARLDDLIGFARRHGLKIGTIRDLIEYRMRYDHLVERASESEFVSDYGGDWKAMTYRNAVDGSTHVALQKGVVKQGKPTLVRMHRISIFDDVLGRKGERKRTLQRAMKAIGENGSGVVVLLMPNRPESLQNEVGGVRSADTGELREYGVGAQILADLGVHEMELLTNSHHNVVGLEGYGITVTGERPIPE
jgi:3,4-dihydroxy 2-butanone 4-phosphate synthase/GTP cyclohydrolase II